MSRIPAAWQREIDAGTAFGQRAAAAAAKIKNCHQATGQSETRPRHREPVGSMLCRQLAGFEQVKARECGCVRLAQLMDEWGVAGCESRRAEIIGTIIDSRQQFTDSAWWLRGAMREACEVLAGMWPDDETEFIESFGDAAAELARAGQREALLSHIAAHMHLDSAISGVWRQHIDSGLVVVTPAGLRYHDE